MIIFKHADSRSMPGPLDDLDAIRAVDTCSMLEQIVGLPDQLKPALQWGIELKHAPDGVAIIGMGGSAVGGDILADYASTISDRPISVVRGVELPRWICKRTLVVMVSYSGNTWEVLELYRRAKERGCAMVAIASGGELSREADADGVPLLKVPAGLQPRAALGYLLGAEGAVLDAAGIAPVKKDLALAQLAMADLRENLSPGVPTGANMAKKTALKLKGKIPVVYAPRTFRTVAYRWQTQINENAKTMAFSGEFPEMNHNQIVGWVEGHPSMEMLPVFLKPASSKGNLGEKMEVAIKLMREAKLQPLSIELSGRTSLETSLMGIMLGDFTSFYLAVLKGVDPSPVSCIGELKKRMC
ncbi:MAG: bifunctional phosphoglucose/phosphomannose isomerase [Methanomassiliicoccales archaeon]|nr:bifunctional phosphoglucose/phosphomannose isomerase [Methanomassiliicoccales archaeon]